MWKRRVPALITVALLALVSVAGSAGASMFRFERGGSVTIGGTITGELEGLRVTCNVTLLGTLTSSLVGVARETTIGGLTESRTEGCSFGASVRVLTPRAIVSPVILITGEGAVVGVLALIEHFGVLVRDILGRACLYGGDVGILIGSSEEEVAIVEVLEETSLVRVTTLSGSCPLVMPWSASLTMRPGQRVVYLP
jgi:hypothetical protein